MRSGRLVGSMFVAAALGATLVVAACSGDDGQTGPAGSPGPTGAQGQPGPPGEGAPGTDGGATPLSGACTQPCHTFNGVVDQWRFSNHSHPQNSEIGGGACGNCHGIDGIEQRRANKFVAVTDAGAPANVPQGHISFTASNGSVGEIAYGGATTIGRIHCSTCHDFNATNDPHVTGKYTARQAPLRVPGGVNDVAYLEASPADAGATVGQPLAYRSANLCVFCHKSRKDVKFYVPANRTMNSYRWGPHEATQADVFSGKGGYEFAGKSYGVAKHQEIADACVSCHMQPAPGNGDVPDHTMKPALTLCKTCHGQSMTTYDPTGGRNNLIAGLRELRTLLNDRNLLTRATVAPYAGLNEEEVADTQFHLDKVRQNSGPAGAHQTLSADEAGAVYNYLIIARSKDLGAHNPVYTRQLLWDSISLLKLGVAPAVLSAPNRP